MKPVIEIHQISKRYFLQEGRRYLALREVITNSFKNLFYRRRDLRREFWALQDINLHITPGERIGIVGKNGAGKSTLLKIISRITPPTSGSAIVRGRVGSLLEVGTGFHPELTGRENVYLNGSIIGLKKKDIDRQFDAIVDFSGVAAFLETPLKNYSSGMQMRLAFAVAAHLDTNILLIDEVLAVGDAEFQKKCLGKMKEMSQEKGRTILFISHNMAVVKQLCTKGILLESGRITYQGDIQSAVAQYTANFNSIPGQTDTACFNLCHHPNKVSDAEGLLSAALYVDGVLTKDFLPGSTLKILLTYKIKAPLIDPEIGLIIKDEEDYSIIGLNNKHIGRKLQLKVGEEAQAIILIPGLNIYSPGKYHIDLYFGDGHHFYESLYYACNFTIAEYDIYNSGAAPGPQWNKIFIRGIDIQA